MSIIALCCFKIKAFHNDIENKRKNKMVKHISSGSPFEKKIGYSRAVVDGDMIYVSGTTGYDYETMILPKDVGEQTKNILKTIAKALEQAGCSIDDVLRVRYYLKTLSDLDIVTPILGETFNKAKPAATLVIADLIKDEIKIEIEVSARIGAHGSKKKEK